MPGSTIKDIASALSATCVGQDDLIVHGASEPANASADQLAIAMTPKFADDLRQGAAKAALLWEDADWQAFGLKAAILVKRPRLAMAALTKHMHQKSEAPTGIQPTAQIDPTAVVGDDASIDHFVVIGAGVTIGKSVQIGPHVSIGAGSTLGNNCILQAGAQIMGNVTLGNRVHVHPGVTLGADGFSFVTQEKSNVESTRETLGQAGTGKTGQPWIKIYSNGGVRIGDDVEIGANTNVDAGTIRPTSIGDGTKLDSLVQVGHNVRIGKNCLLCAQVGVAGSAVIGDAVVMGGKAGITDNISVGDGCVVGAASVVLSNVPAGRAVMGQPAVKMDIYFETYKAMRRLPRMMQNLKNP